MPHSHQALVIIMARAPVAGHTKTRLAAGIGGPAAADWARRTLWRLCARLQAPARWSLCLAVTPPSAPAGAFPPALPQIPQGDGDLGQRMERLLTPGAADPAGGWPRVIVGSDLPGLEAAHVEVALCLLEQHPGEVLLGPAQDGGFWLIGSTQPLVPGTLAGLSWSHPQVLAQTRARLIQRGHRVRLHPQHLSDVDQASDLVQPRAGLDLAGVRQVLADQRPELAGAAMALEPLPDTGLAHDHVRLLGAAAGDPPLLLRIPKQSQMGLAPHAALAYEQACYAAAADSGHTPQLHGVLAPTPGLPRGALLVEEVAGRAPRLPADLPAIMVALAALHRRPLPPVAARAPLLSAADPLGQMRAEIADQARHIDRAGLEAGDRQAIAQALAGLERLPAGAAVGPPTVALVTFDAHPGNWLIDSAGRAWIVDLEKMRYALPGFDLAHATLYTSTTWDVATCAVIDDDQARAAYRIWARAMGPLAALHWPWLATARVAMLLWSLSWCAMWRVTHGGDGAAARGQDWSQSLSAQALVRHVRDRVDTYLAPGRPLQLLQDAAAFGDRLVPA